MSTAPGKMATEADELEFLIAELDTLYETGEPCVAPIDVTIAGVTRLEAGTEMPDVLYDAVRKRLREIRPQSPVLQAVTASKAHSGQARIRHDPPMTSLEKASGVNKLLEFQDWLANVYRTLGYATGATRKIVQSYKHDGVACALYYIDGNLVAAGLRPRDGIMGEDILANVRFVRGVQAKLPVPFSGSVRGELECPISAFKVIKGDWQNPVYGLDKEPSNPRNYTTGSIRQFKDPQVTEHRGIQFVGYMIENLTFPSGYAGFVPRTKRQQAKWANQALGINFVRVEYHNDGDLQKLEALYPSLDYEVDGIVLAVDDLEDYEQMGRHGDRVTGNPRGAIAWKFEDEVATTPFERRIWSAGRTGKLTPVLQFTTPLRLAGTNVTQCSEHNLAFCVRNQIGPGVTLEVIKSGKIIPKLVAVIQPDGTRRTTESTAGQKVTRAQAEAFPHPDTCPACGHPTHVEAGQEGMWELACRNALCPAQIVSTFVFFLTTLGARGLGESQVEKLLVAGKIKTLADLYKLRQSDLEAAGLSERQSTLALAAVHMVEAPSQEKDNEKLKARVAAAIGRPKRVAAWHLFAALGIPTAGKEAGKLLIDHFRTFERILDAPASALSEVGGIGDKTAAIIADYMRENRTIVEQLLGYLELEVPTSGPMEGKTFCLSGSCPPDKKYWEKRIEGLGGACVGSVSKKVDYLVAGDGSGSKTKAAEVLQGQGHPIQILDVAGLEALLP